MNFLAPKKKSEELFICYYQEQFLDSYIICLGKNSWRNHLPCSGKLKTVLVHENLLKIILMSWKSSRELPFWSWKPLEIKIIVKSAIIEVFLSLNTETKACDCHHVIEAKSLKDDCTLESLDLGRNGKLYFRDLGPQVGWSTVSNWRTENVHS